MWNVEPAIERLSFNLVLLCAGSTCNLQLDDAIPGRCLLLQTYVSLLSNSVISYLFPQCCAAFHLSSEGGF